MARTHAARQFLPVYQRVDRGVCVGGGCNIWCDAAMASVVVVCMLPCDGTRGGATAGPAAPLHVHWLPACSPELPLANRVAGHI